MRKSDRRYRAFDASCEMTVPMLFSADETCDVGKQTGSAVSSDYGPAHNEFSGAVNWVQIDLEEPITVT
jgi:hypothetical protein